MNRIYLLITVILLCLIVVPNHAQTINWEEVAPGVWKGIVGQPEAYDLLKASDATPRYEALREMVEAKFPLSQSKISGEIIDGKAALRFPLEREEQIFGFGLNFKTVHQRGRILQLHVDHYGGEDNGRTHAPVPFYVSSEGYGVFINSARYLEVYCGTAVRKDSENPPAVRDRNTDKNWTARPYSDAVEIFLPAKGVEVFVFAGPSPLDAVRRFNLFNGGGPLPPRWGLGFTQRVHRLYSAEEVIEEAKSFKEKGFPLDFIGLEPGWQSVSYPNSYVWDQQRFPEPKQFVDELGEMGVKVNLWVNPYVAPSSPIYESIAPYTASHTVWAGMVPDFNIEKANDIFWGHFEKEHLDVGVSGYKIDEVDGYDRWLWPDMAKFPSGTSAEQMRQTYGLLVQKQSTAIFKERNQRTYGLIRASNGGGVRFPYVIYNDYYNHQDFITALINSGFSGILWTPEARASETAEEWLRRMQSVVFSPMAMINAWASGTKPWSYEEVADEVREMTLLRMQMMPYWYTEFAKYHFYGTPPFRAMNLEEGFQMSSQTLSSSEKANLEENPYAEAIRKEVKDQYMAGEYLLVAPMFAGETSRLVILPRGKWYDFYTGEYVGNGEVISASPGMERIPVFVKDGGVIPMTEVRLHAPSKNENVDLEVRHYGEKTGTALLYDDDGETFDYEKGDFSWRKLTVSRDSKGNLKGSDSKPDKSKTTTYSQITWRFMTTQK